MIMLPSKQRANLTLSSQQQQQQQQQQQLLTGLDNCELIKNPRQVYQELFAHSTFSASHSSDRTKQDKELIELQLPLNDDVSFLIPDRQLLEANRLPNIIGAFGCCWHNQAASCEIPGQPFSDGCQAATSLEPFVCRCPVLAVDLQRELYQERNLQQQLDLAVRCDQRSPTWLDKLKPQPQESLGIDGNGDLIAIGLPDRDSQVRVFGRLARNRVAKRLQLAKRIRRAIGARTSPSCPSAGNAGLNSKQDEQSVWLNNDQVSLAMYKLERLLREATVYLAASLFEAARASAERLTLILNPPRVAGGGGSLEEVNSADHRPIGVMIRAPVGQTSRRRRRRWTIETTKTTMFDSKLGSLTTRKLLAAVCQSGDSGISEEAAEDLVKLELDGDALDWHVKLRSSEPIQSIVAYSISLFGKLVQECPLFVNLPSLPDKTSKLELDLPSLAEWKLFACVECQKMRSVIRFKWIAKCLELAFAKSTPLSRAQEAKGCCYERKAFANSGGGERSLNFSGDKANCLRQANSANINDNDHLPKVVDIDGRQSLEGERLLESRYLDLLALVMGQLLRRHFVEDALERFCCLFEESQFPNLCSTDKASASLGKPRLLVQVELVEAPGADQPLTCSPADQQLKQAAAFLVDELVSICAHLPRLETQLESEQIQLRRFSDTDSAAGAPNAGKCLFVLQGDDDCLLVKTKARLEGIIERSLPINKLVLNSIQSADERRKRFAWHDQDYLIAVELVNRFRLGSIAQMSPKLVEKVIANWPLDIKDLDGIHMIDQIEEYHAHDNDRLRQLRLSCQQIRLLDSLETRLNCQMDTLYDFGLVLLDCEPLRKSLIRCVQKERNLMVRLNLDDLLKLMERLRLQFDEIELGLDLEAAIEDYLAEKWQAKHREQPQQEQLILAGGDGEDDDDVVNLEPPFDQNGTGATDYELNMPAFGRRTKPEQIDIPADDNDNDSLEHVQDDGGKDEPDDDEEFVNALTSGNVDTAQANQQLLVLRGAANSSKSGQILAAEELVANLERRVAPLIECQLLVDRYEYLSKLLNKELEPLVNDLEVSFEGLTFLSEFVGQNQLEPSHSDLINELLLRSQEFTTILSESLKGLDKARQRLIRLNKLRCRVLSKLVVEFHLLMVVISRRQLAVSSTLSATGPIVTSPDLNITSTSNQRDLDSSPGGSSGATNVGLNIRQLDSIQEASDWAQKLEVRFDFLCRQNCLLARENTLLTRAKLSDNSGGCESLTGGTPLISEDRKETQWRSIILDRWHLLVVAIANLWRLAEDYETQQVKWLNSDIKRIDFAQIDHTFKRFQQRLDRLRCDCEQSGELQQEIDKELRLVLFSNLEELQVRLDQFATMRIPIFRFLTNKHLTEAHWSRLTHLLETDKSRSGAGALTGLSSSISPQACTTLAQFLELNVDNHVAELIEMNEEAINEYQLTMFLLAEATRSALLGAGSRKMATERGIKVNLWQLDVSAWLESWSDKQLIVAASRFIETKLIECSSTTLQDRVDCSYLGSKLVTCHSLAKRYLALRYNLNLEATRASQNVCGHNDKGNNSKVTIRSNNLLSSSALIRPALFVEFLRLFTENWIEAQIKLATRINHCEQTIATLTGHLNDIGALVDRVKQVHEGDLRQASVESEQMLAYLEKQTVKLELEREILATKEAQAVEQQQRALKTRDECIKQITERAIPAIRAATKALDCLDERSLRFLRSIKPSPPEPVRLVIEAVCLLRSCAISRTTSNQVKAIKSSSSNLIQVRKHHEYLEPNRHFDAVRGLIIEDYWPVASRMLIGTHSSRFISDLRRVDKKTIPVSVMQLIRKRYLSSNSFNVRLIEKVSRECALLAKWLIAVDVFDRVINVVRPNYHAYMESEKKLSELLFEVDNRRREIEAIGVELQQMEDSFEIKVGHKMALINSLDQCKSQLQQMEATRIELIQRRSASSNKLTRFERKRRQLAERCLRRAARVVYVEAMRTEEQKPMIDLIKISLSNERLSAAS